MRTLARLLVLLLISVGLVAGGLTPLPALASALPGAPLSVTAIAAETSVTVSWQPPADPGTPALHQYEVVSDPDNLRVLVPGSSTTATVWGVETGVPYRFRVRARNADGWGPLSAPSAAVTPAPASLGTGGMAVGTVTTIVGTGSATTSAGSGTAAGLNSPGGVVVSGGVAYVATADAVVATVLASGASTVLAGLPGTLGCTNGSAETARFNGVVDAVTDGSWLYTASTSCGLRRTSLTTGATSLVSNAHTSAVASVTLWGGYLYLTMQSQGTVYRVDPATGASTLWTGSEGTCPGVRTFGLAADADYLYVSTADMGCSGTVSNARIRRFAPDKSVITLVTSPLLGQGPLLDRGGFLYTTGLPAGVRSANAGPRLISVEKSTGAVRSVAGSSGGYRDGTGTDVFFKDVTDIAADGAALLVADKRNHRIRRVAAGTRLPAGQPAASRKAPMLAGGAFRGFAGSGASTTSTGTLGTAGLPQARGLAVHGSSLLVGTTDTLSRINVDTGQVDFLAGASGVVANTDADSGSASRVYLVDEVVTDDHYAYLLTSGTIRRTNLKTGATSYVAKASSTGDDYRDIALTPDGRLIAIRDRAIELIDPASGAATTFRPMPPDFGDTITADRLHGVATDGHVVYLVGAGANAADVPAVSWLGAYSLADGAELARVGLFDGVQQRGPRLAAGGGKVYVASPVNGTSTSPYKLLGFSAHLSDTWLIGQTSANVVGMVTDGNRLYFSDPSAHRVNIVEPAPLLALPGQSFGLACQGGCSSLDPITGHQMLDGEPVNTATGHLTEWFTDAALAAPGIPFRFTRVYNSADATTGPLGTGWTHPYLSAATIAGSGDVTIRSEEGQQALYKLQQDGTFLTPPGIRAVLTLAGGVYTLRRRDGGSLTFDSGGRLTSTKDRAGVGLTFSHTGGDLTGITDAGGHTVTLSYTAGRLTRLALADDRDVTFGYDASGRLTSVTDLRGKTSTYGYDSAGRLERITDPLGHHIVRNTYDGSGRVISQLDPLGKATTFDYDASTGVTKVTDPEGGETRYRYTGMLLVAITDPEGRTVRYTYDDRLNRTSITDPLGVITDYDYDERGNVVRVVHPYRFVESFTYDSDNRLTSQTDVRGFTTSYSYDPVTAKIASTTDAENRTVSTTYTSQGQPDVVTDARGHTSKFTYNTQGLVASLAQQQTGHKTTYGYDGTGRLTSITTPRGNEPGAVAADYTRTMQYDDADNLTATTDAEGGTVSWVRDDASNLITLTDARGKATHYTYDAANRLATSTDPRGAVTSYDYDDAGRLTSTTTPAGTTTTTYNQAGQPVSRTAPRGNVTGAAAADHTTSFTYDAAGRLVTSSHPTAGTTTISYDALGRITARTDAAGHRTQYELDKAGNRTAVTDPLGNTTRYTYDGVGQLTAASDPRNPSWLTQFGYDPAGHLSSRTSPVGGVTSWQYDADGRLTAETEPRGNVPGATPADYTTTYERDANGNLTKVTNALGQVVANYTYDGADRVLTAVSHAATPGTTAYSYFPGGLLKEITATAAGTTTFGYDNSGNLTQRVDAKQHTTSWTYDLAGRLNSLETHLGRRTTFTYDANGNLATKVTARGNATVAAGDGTIAYTHDAADRLIGIDYSDGTPDVSLSYDSRGLRTSMTDGTGTTTFAYDDAARLTGVTRAGSSFGYAYDAAGHLTTRTYPNGTSFDHTYDAGGRVDSLEAPGGTTTYGYDVADRLTTTTLPSANGHVESREYDRAGRLSKLTNSRGSSVLSRFAYTRDAAGNPTRIDATRGTTTTSEAYTYDAQGRVLEACYDTGSCSPTTTSRIIYGYDVVGNRTSQQRAGVSAPGLVSYSYDEDDHLTVRAAGTNVTSYGYDADGNQTTAGLRSDVYDLENRLVSSATGGLTPTTVAFGYDGDGKRTSRTVTAASGVTTTALAWDVNHPLPMLASETTSSASTTYGYDPLGNPHSVVEAATSRYFHRDGLGSTSEITDASGGTVSTYTYDPFGNPRPASLTAPPADANPLRYAGQYLDAAVGQYHLRARDYDPAQGRFTAIDPIDLTSGPRISPYAYAHNRPTLFTDPSGLCIGPDWLCEAGTAAKGVAKEIGDTAADAARAVLHPDETARAAWNGAKAIAAQCKRGFDSGVLKGWAECNYALNPLAPAVEAYQAAARFIDQGCTELAARALMRGPIDVATFIASAGAGGAAVKATRAGRAANSGRTFASADAHVADAANLIERAMPGRVAGVNSHVPMTNGLSREIDIDLGNLLIQVKSGNARGLTGQLASTTSSTGRTAIGYAPSMPDAAWLNAARQGIPIARTPDELLAIIRELG